MNVNSEIKIIVTRDSVCAADDYIDPPHTKIFDIDSNIDTKQLIKKIEKDYLPKIDGFGHKWRIYLNDNWIGTSSFFRNYIEISKPEYLDENVLHCRYESASW